MPPKEKAASDWWDDNLATDIMGKDGAKSKATSEWDDGASASRGKSKQQSGWDDGPKAKAKSKAQSEWDDEPKAKAKQQSEVCWHRRNAQTRLTD